jgi:hypothetical protein
MAALPQDTLQEYFNRTHMIRGSMTDTLRPELVSKHGRKLRRNHDVSAPMFNPQSQ